MFNPCEKCWQLFMKGKISASEMHTATDKHHLFPDTIVNRKLYKKLIDNPKNISWRCKKHHTGFENPEHISEQEFCDRLGIEPRSKLLKQRKLNNG